MINKVIAILVFILMVFVVIVSFPIAMTSVAWEVGKDWYHGRKPKIWGMG